MKKYLLILFLIFIQNNIVAQEDAPGPDWSNMTPSDQEPLDPRDDSMDSVIFESLFIDNYIKNLKEGQLIYNPPNEMILNRSEQITAIITQEGGEGEKIKVAPIMEVSLNGPAFKINNITRSRQPIARTRPTTWKWDVEPKRIGNQTLNLLAYVIVKMPDGHEESQALVKNKTIMVMVNPLELSAPISIKSNPSGARAIVDGIYRGTTPIILSDLPIGPHQLILVHPGYHDFEIVILSKPESINLTFDLEPEKEPSILSNPYVIAALVAALASIVVAYLNNRKKAKRKN